MSFSSAHKPANSVAKCLLIVFERRMDKAEVTNRSNRLVFHFYEHTQTYRMNLQLVFLKTMRNCYRCLVVWKTMDVRDTIRCFDVWFKALNG